MVNKAKQDIIKRSKEITENYFHFLGRHIADAVSGTTFSTYGKRRILIKSGVSYGGDLEHAKGVAIDEIKKARSFTQ